MTIMMNVAQLLGLFALSDISAPPFWGTDALLRTIEGLLIRQDNNPTAFAAVCQGALPMVKDPSVRALLLLAVINGLRRIDDGDADQVNQLFTEVRAEIDALPDGPRKDRCLSFLLYQAKVFLARNGFYAEAAKAQAEDAAATTNSAERAVSIYLSHVYTMWDVLVTGKPIDGETLLEELLSQLEELRRDVAGSNLELQWGQGNGPTHVLRVLFLIHGMNPSWDILMQGILQVRESLGSAFASWIAVFEAEDQLRKGNKDAALPLAQRIVEENASADTTAAARLIIARILLGGNSDKLAAHEMYEQIKPAPDAHMIAAVAASEKDAWLKP